MVQASSADSLQKSGSGSGSRAAAQVVKLREDLPKSWEEFTRWYEVRCVPAVAVCCALLAMETDLHSVQYHDCLTWFAHEQSTQYATYCLLQGVIQELAPLLAPAQTGDDPEAAARVEALWCDLLATATAPCSAVDGG